MQRVHYLFKHDLSMLELQLNRVSALTLLKTRVLLVDYKDFALTADNLAILRATLDA